MRAFRIESLGADLRFDDRPGAGTPLMFVHGLGCASSVDYPTVAADSALADRRLLLVDLLGSGLSDRPAAFGYTIADHAATLGALADGLGLAALDVLGHSMGGAVAIALASARRDLVRRLVLTEPNLDAGGGAFSRPIAAQDERAFVERGHAAAVRQALARGEAVWARTLEASAPWAVHRAAVSLVRGATPSWRARLEALAVPRTVVFGERSLPDPDTERLPRAGIAVRVLPGVGHAMANEDPAALAAAVRAALPGTVAA